MISWLDRVCNLKIKLWKYTPELDPNQKLHIGPMAEQWKLVMGIGDGIHIDPVDALGVSLKAIQELRAELQDLRDKVNRFTGDK